MLTSDSQKQYEQFALLAKEGENLICCGRLGAFKYYNMDQTLERALEICISEKNIDEIEPQYLELKNQTLKNSLKKYTY